VTNKPLVTAVYTANQYSYIHIDAYKVLVLPVSFITVQKQAGSGKTFLFYFETSSDDTTCDITKQLTKKTK